MGIFSFRLMAIGRCTQVRSLLVGRDVFEYVAIIFGSKCLVYLGIFYWGHKIKSSSNNDGTILMVLPISSGIC